MLLAAGDLTLETALRHTQDAEEALTVTAALSQARMSSPPTLSCEDFMLRTGDIPHGYHDSALPGGFTPGSAGGGGCRVEGGRGGGGWNEGLTA